MAGQPALLGMVGGYPPANWQPSSSTQASHSSPRAHLAHVHHEMATDVETVHRSDGCELFTHGLVWILLLENFILSLFKRGNGGLIIGEQVLVHFVHGWVDGVARVINAHGILREYSRIRPDSYQHKPMGSHASNERRPGRQGSPLNQMRYR